MIVACPSCSQENRLPAARIADRARCAACKAQLLPLTAPLAIETRDDFDELVRESPVPVVVDFWADWCAPCRMVAPELVKLAEQRSGSVVVAKVDTEALPEVAGRFRIRSIPTMIAFRAGRESKRTMGSMPANVIAAQLGV